MSHYSRVHFSDSVLLRRAASNAAHDHSHTAELLADLAEIDARKLYLPAACPSMLVFCVRDLHYSEDEAFKRIRVARVAREFPAIFESVADGRLSLTAVVQIAPHLTAGTAGDVIAAAAHRSKTEIQRLIAERFPRPDVPTRLERVTSSATSSDQLVPEPVAPLTSQRVTPGKPDRIEPLARERHALQLTIDDETVALLEGAQRLLSHQLRPGDISGVIKRALQALVPALEKRKFAATNNPRRGQRHSTVPRHVPAHVKNAVWKRDGGQCAFVSETGQRCPSRTLLEFDHVLAVARGGRATVAGIRLLCRVHNQFAAERAFGAEFMEHKREEARCIAARGAKGKLATACNTNQVTAPEDNSHDRGNDVVPYLRRLGFRVDETRRAATFCARIPEASLEVRVRSALSFLRR